MNCKVMDDGIEFLKPSGEAVKYTLLQVKPFELQQYIKELDIVGGVFATLKNAQIALSGGRGLYDDARNNVGNLLSELQMAAIEAENVARKAGVFYDPPGLSDVMEAPVDDLLRFALSTVKNLEVKISARA